MPDPEEAPETAPGGRGRKVNPDKLVQSAELPGYRFLLYEGALHPELFSLRARRVLSSGLYEVEIWLMRGSHLVRFGHARHCVCELLTDRQRHLPTVGVVHEFRCADFHEHEHLFASSGLNCLVAIQSETLSESQYVATVDEFLTFRGDGEMLSHAWRDETGPCLSIVDVQQHNREVHVQSFHLVARTRMVLRSQTIFELVPESSAAPCS